MNIHEYIVSAVRTEKVPHVQIPVEVGLGRTIASLSFTEPGIRGRDEVRLLHSALGMSTEIAELQEATSSGDRVHILEELGDILWYWAVGCSVLEWDGNPLIRDEELVLEMLEAENRLIAYICEWADLVRRHVIHNKPLDVEKAQAVLWEIHSKVGEVCRAWRIRREDVMERNIAKLRARFPDKYDGLRFEERDLGAERQVLEAKAAVEAVDALLSMSPIEREVLRVFHDGIDCYQVSLPGRIDFVPVVDLWVRCICIGHPPAPGRPGYCPQHPKR